MICIFEYLYFMFNKMFLDSIIYFIDYYLFETVDFIRYLYLEYLNFSEVYFIITVAIMAIS